MKYSGSGCQQTYVADTVSQSGLGLDDMLT
jgi:hypothetical protein